MVWVVAGVSKNRVVDNLLHSGHHPRMKVLNLTFLHTWLVNGQLGTQENSVIKSSAQVLVYHLSIEYFVAN